jgi:hypothetical protein
MPLYSLRDGENQICGGSLLRQKNIARNISEMWELLE